MYKYFKLFETFQHEIVVQTADRDCDWFLKLNSVEHKLIIITVNFKSY